MLKSKKLLRSAIVLAALAPFASGAHADADTYFGIGAGGVKAKGHTDELFADVAGATSTDKTSSTGVKVYWGYAFRPLLAVEVQYANLGTVARRDWTPAVDANAALKVNAWSASLLGRVPLGSEFSVFGKLGPYLAEQQQSQNGTGFGGDNKTTSTQTGWASGLGADWRFDKAWSL